MNRPAKPNNTESLPERNARLRDMVKGLAEHNQSLRESDAAWAATCEHYRRRIGDIEFELYIERLPTNRFLKWLRRMKWRLTCRLYKRKVRAK